MKMLNCGSGPPLLCLTMLSSCTSTAPSPAPLHISNTCAPVTACTLPAVKLRTNGDLRVALDHAENAWAECAAVVDMIAACQAKEGGNVP